MYPSLSLFSYIPFSDRLELETATIAEKAAVRHRLPVRNGLLPEIIRPVLDNLECDWDSLRSAILMNST